ncbi:MAG TPA: hypothetical protein VK540_30815 [Polyangiaceae bacterium]|nr:hypothetical protein [Polyangiaceae bacterium]
MHGLSHGNVALALCLFGLSQSGCDIVQGFRDASAAVFPEEKTYFDAPGFRLVRGGYREIEFASGSSLYLLARPADREDHSLHVMRYADPRPCVLNNVQAHRAGAGTFVDATTIAYTEEGTEQGTLRFADGDCHTYDISVPSSRIPFFETPEGFLTYHGRDLFIVNPVTGMTRTIVPEFSLLTGFSAFYVIGSRGRIGAFTTDFKEVAWFGDGVGPNGAAGSSFFYEDTAGIHRLVAASAASVTDTVIAADGCNLAITRNLGTAENWVTYFSPCSEKKLVVFSESVGKSSVLDISADPGNMVFLPEFPSQTGDPAVDRFFVFYLTEVDGNVGQLMMRTPDRKTKVIGQRAAFERLTVLAGKETYGYALVEVNGEVGRFVRWDADGSTLGIAQDVARGPGDLVVDFNGETGQFALLSEEGLSIVSRRVPASDFKIRDDKNRWTAIIDDYQDSIASLYITESSLDFTEAARKPAPPPLRTLIAHGVRWDSRTRFVPALPGIAFFTHYDPVTDIGRLEYRNLELQFTATVSDGVSAYLTTPGGLIYAVPFGDSAGIWVVRSR